MSCPGRVNQSNLMLRRDSPVPGNDTDARTPDSLALSVTWNGPSLIDLVNDLTPRSVMLKPAIVLSKLIGDLVIFIVINRVSSSNYKFQNKVIIISIL